MSALRPESLAPQPRPKRFGRARHASGSWLVALLALCAACPVPCRAGEEERPRTFVKALETYDAARSPEDFRRAALLFESILSDGYENGAVLYNLGNAYMRAGQPGPAIAAYRRAERLRPRDPDVQANLQTARGAAPGVLASPPPPWWQRVLFWHAALAQGERLRCAAGAFVTAFLLATLRLLLRGREARPLHGLRWTACAALAAGLLLSASATLGWVDEELTRYGVLRGEVQARKGNGESYAPAFDRTLKEGAEFVVLETRSGWVRANLPGAGEGWLPEKDVVLY